MNPASRPPADEPAPAPVASPRLARELFLPQLERYLSDPDELPLDDSSDSVRVRIDQAIRSIEGRVEELLPPARARVTQWRMATGSCAIIGILAALVALASPHLAPVAISVVLVEIFALLYSTRRARRAALDVLILEGLEARHRPRLEAAGNLTELRQLAADIREDMERLTVDPRPAG